MQDDTHEAQAPGLDPCPVDAPNQDKCPVTACLAVIGGKWKPVILFFIIHGVDRFGVLKREIPGISKQMLTKQLREMEQDELIHREVFAEVPPRVEYSVTPYGETLLPVVNQMRLWGEKHLGLVD